MAAKYGTREEWLMVAVEALRAEFTAQAATLPERIRVSCGWPSSGGLGRKRRTVGECWHPEASQDQAVEVFISPTLGSAVDALDTLTHELVHAAVGCKAGHGPVFRRLALAVGLTGKMRSAAAGPELRHRLMAMAERLGAYPHAELRGGAASDKPPKQGTRMVKCECPKCGYTLRTTRKWLEVAVPNCPACDLGMKVEGA